jgi:protein involved in polysaccharide export with SLBB domain
MLLAAGSADAAEPEPGAVRAAPPPASPAGASSALATGTHAFPTMDTLESRHRLALGDRLSFRIVEDQEDPREPLDPKQPITVTDSGDVEVPYIGSFPAAGKTCKQLARELKTELEKIPVDPRESAAGA